METPEIPLLPTANLHCQAAQLLPSVENNRNEVSTDRNAQVRLNLERMPVLRWCEIRLDPPTYCRSFGSSCMSCYRRGSNRERKEQGAYDSFRDSRDLIPADGEDTPSGSTETVAVLRDHARFLPVHRSITARPVRPLYHTTATDEIVNAETKKPASPAETLEISLLPTANLKFQSDSKSLPPALIDWMHYLNPLVLAIDREEEVMDTKKV
ncbi:hypothetical protein BZA05DRAFT_476500 [Tricharina praecox]|uniref:uncharacterized protein n=1 Tax=Tricharina praecox TaxID=43433 RepID=UPI00221EB429|nr:uncharacterized protein BZA05DRAFT_476500 [Tricharina praecox]KAI5845315.1 hypothetical protein BZA05DRAFT_476500 [Tricharina praecox]